MTIEEAIAAAESILPGQPAPDGELDDRWQAVIAVAEFIETEPEAVWAFTKKWGRHPDDDVRTAIWTCLLEHLLEQHFDAFISRVEEAAKADRLFADAVASCATAVNALRESSPEWRKRAARFDRLSASIR
jgi:hypothetical protein